MLVPFERHGDARDAEERPFDRGGHGARVEHVDPRVEAAVDPADDQIGPPRTELRDPELDRVGRTAVHGPAAAPVTVEHLLGRQWRQERDRMPHAALLGGGCDDLHVAQLGEGFFQGGEPRGEDPVVVGEHDEHGREYTVYWRAFPTRPACPTRR